jgi:hypothetical protein
VYGMELGRAAGTPSSGRMSQFEQEQAAARAKAEADRREALVRAEKEAFERQEVARAKLAEDTRAREEERRQVLLAPFPLPSLCLSLGRDSGRALRPGPGSLSLSLTHVLDG